MEIDFIIRYNGEPTLVEVKSKTGHTKASNHILSEYHTYRVKNLIKLGEYNIGYVDNKLTLPYYLTFLLVE